MIKNFNDFNNVNVNIIIGTPLVPPDKTVKISTYYDHTEKGHGVTGYEQETEDPNRADCLNLGNLAKIGSDS